MGDAVKVAEARSDGGCWPGQLEVGNDRVRALLEADQEVERIALLLGARTQDTGDDRLRRGAARRAVAPADLPRHDGRADRLFRLPVGRFDVGAALTLDEFALWLRLEDVYWAREGRESIDARACARAN